VTARTRLRVVDDAAAVALAAASHVAAAAARATSARGAFHLALAGGTTPRAAYQALAKLPVEWGAVHAWFGDERAVSADDPDSNYRMAKEALFDHVAIPSANVHRMVGESADLDGAAAAYSAALPPSLDLILLGMGEDGHTASLFPGSRAVLETGRAVVPVVGPKPPPRRLTVTRRVLDAARELVVLVTGSGKADVLARALAGPEAPTELPVQLARDGLFIVDRAAARALDPDWIAAHGHAGDSHG
jgi:6-phosphogluconolactonase